MVGRKVLLSFAPLAVQVAIMLDPCPYTRLLALKLGRPPPRGIIVIRTFDRHKNLHIPVFLRTVFGPDYRVPL